MYQFLAGNKGPGPVGEISDMDHVEPGDIVQLQFEGKNRFSHTLMIDDIKKPVTKSSIFVTTHDRNCFHCPLSEYVYSDCRFIRIIGVNY